MTNTTYPYDEHLPYVVNTGEGVARFEDKAHAECFSRTFMLPPGVIDTTPKPRVPEDAEFITWTGGGGSRWYAQRLPSGEWQEDDGNTFRTLEELSGVLPETTFTVLEERKTDA